LNKLDFGAITLGFFASIVVGFVIGWFAGALGIRIELFPLLILDLLGCILSGFVAAYYSKDYKFYNAIATSLVGCILWLFFITSYPIWFSCLSIILSFPLAYFGARIESKI
jgi:uncharacterized membrane protein YeaQ/YmgE (transglycosylase-associated protein family)